jgi:hypothetical protein
VDVGLSTGAYQGAQYTVRLCTTFRYEDGALACDMWSQLGAGTVGSSSTGQPSAAKLSNMGTMTLCEVSNAAGNDLPCAKLKWIRMTLKSDARNGLRGDV